MDDEKYLLYQRGNLNFFALSCFFTVKKQYRKLVSKDFGEFICATKGDHLFWMYEKKWLLREGSRIVRQMINNKSFKKDFILTWNQQVVFCDNFINKFRSIKLKNKNYAELLQLSIEIKKTLEPYLVFTGLTLDFLDEIVFYEMKDILSKKIQKNFEEKFSQITTAIETTYTNKRDLSFWKIFNIIEANKNLRKVFLNENLKIIKKAVRSQKIIYKMILDHLDSFWWIKLGWSPLTAETETVLINEIKNALINKKNAKKEIRLISSRSALIVQSKKDVLKKLKINDSHFNRLLNLLEEMAIYHDQRKEYQVKMLYCAFQILKEISVRDKKISFNDLLWYSKDEVIEYLKFYKRLSLHEIKLRKQATINHEDKSGIYRKFGAKAEEDFKKYIDGNNFKKEIKETKEIIRTVAYRGQVSGIVKMAYSSKELIKKMNKGDVMVTSMTLPDFVPAMKKAAAIITDEGGITCHAVIISRELGIPCIIGTKIATKVLKDGQLVEVDANLGVVRILKK